MCLVFCKDTATTELYTYLHTRARHAALPIYHAMNPLHGAAKAVIHGVQSLTDRLPQGKPVRQIVGETVASDDAALRQREADYQARVPDSMASYAGAAAGEVVPFAVGAPARLDRKSVV